MTDRPGWIRPSIAPLLSGGESFNGVDASVAEFWAYALRDLRTNTTRGFLAEFLVAKAVGATELPEAWSPYDVRTPAGVRVSVKSSAFLQSWEQQKPSDIRFSGLKAKIWTAEAGYARDATFNADVYVFALQTATHTRTTIRSTSLNGSSASSRWRSSGPSTRTRSDFGRCADTRVSPSATPNSPPRSTVLLVPGSGRACRSVVAGR